MTNATMSFSASKIATSLLTPEVIGKVCSVLSKLVFSNKEATIRTQNLSSLSEHLQSSGIETLREKGSPAALISTLRHSLDKTTDSHGRQALCLYDYLTKNPKLCERLHAVYKNEKGLTPQDKVEAMRFLKVLKAAIGFEGGALSVPSATKRIAPSVEFKELESLLLSKTELALSRGRAAVVKFVKAICGSTE